MVSCCFFIIHRSFNILTFVVCIYSHCILYGTSVLTMVLYQFTVRCIYLRWRILRYCWFIMCKFQFDVIYHWQKLIKCINRLQEDFPRYSVSLSGSIVFYPFWYTQSHLYWWPPISRESPSHVWWLDLLDLATPRDTLGLFRSTLRPPTIHPSAILASWQSMLQVNKTVQASSRYTLLSLVSSFLLFNLFR